MRSIRPNRNREWTRGDYVNLLVHIAVLTIVLTLFLFVLSHTGPGAHIIEEPGQLDSTCLGLWGCDGPSMVDLLPAVPMIIVIAVMIKLNDL